MKKQWMIIPWISLSFLLFGMLQTFCTEFSYNIEWRSYVLIVLLITGTVTFLGIQLKGKYALIAMLAVFFCVGMYVVRNLSYFESDLKTILYYVNQKSMSYNGVVIAEYAKNWKGQTDGSHLLMLVGTGIIIYIAIVAFCLRSKGYGLGVVFFVPATGMWFGQTPSIEAVAFLFVGVLVALAWISSQEHGGRRSFKSQRTKERTPVIFYVILTAVLAIGIFGANYFENKTQTKMLRHSRDVLIKQHRFEKDMTMKVQEMAQFLRGKLGLDSEGRLSNAAPYYTGKTVMEVTVWERPDDDLYLKGFIGGSYQNGKWNESNTEEFKEVLQRKENIKRIQSMNYLSYDVLKDYYSDYTQFSKDIDGIIEDEEDDSFEAGYSRMQQMTIKYTGFGKISKYAYVPYFSNIQGIKNDNGTECIEVNGDNGLHKLQNEFRLLYYPLSLSNQINVCESMRLAELEDWYIVNIPKQELDKYLYFARSEYKELPANGLDEFRKFAASYNDYEGVQGKDALEIISNVRNILGSIAYYSKNLEPVPVNQDYVENFLLTQKKGYCEHFATAGTLLLRYYGIPARYVSGYRVSPKAFKRNSDGSYTAKVIDSDAHSWSEFLYGTMGWIPAEMTPAGDMTKQDYEELAPARSEIIATPHASAKTSSKKTAKPDSKKEQQKQTAVPATSKPVSAKKSENKSSEINLSTKGLLNGRTAVLIIITVVVLTIFLVYILFLLLRYKRTLYQKRLSNLEDEPNQYLLERLSQLLSLIEICGIYDVNKMTDNEWIAKVSEVYTIDISKEESDSICEIIQKAGFAGKNITQEELELFCGFAMRIEQILYEKQNKLKKRYLVIVRGKR